jgi:hypothetical protein
LEDVGKIIRVTEVHGNHFDETFFVFVGEPLANYADGRFQVFPFTSGSVVTVFQRLLSHCILDVSCITLYVIRISILSSWPVLL